MVGINCSVSNASSGVKDNCISVYIVMSGQTYTGSGKKRKQIQLKSMWDFP